MNWQLLVCSGSIATNGSRLGEVGDLEVQSLNFSTNFK
jgi:hypothetical protein